MSDVSIIQMKEEKWLKNFNWNKKNWPFFFSFVFLFYLFSCSSVSFFFFSGLLFEKMITTGFLSSRQVEVGTFQSGCVTHDDGKLSSLFTRVSGSFLGREDSTWKKKSQFVTFFVFLNGPTERTWETQRFVQIPSPLWLRMTKWNRTITSNCENNLKATSFWIFH